jgi:alkanesulfonate monooxygenase SsuD/methylene tetrahydromethanopterin reductase-like flavin-dependent oxidoreductase (luciferase family)
MHLAVALDGAGWHPAAWREPQVSPAELFSAGYWAGLAAEAERGLLDFTTFEDSLSLQSSHPREPDQRTDQIRGRLDAVLVAARVAPLTHHAGLIPTVVVTHTEPFHVSKAIATLDYVSGGRAGVRLRLSASPGEAALFGRRQLPGIALDWRADPAATALLADLCDEAADYAEVLRRLWDSWEDDAEIRDVATGRFIDRSKLHYIDFQSRWFSVRGPSITPRPPQGQPVVLVLAHGGPVFELAGRCADVVCVTPRDAGQAAELVAEIRGAQEAAGRAGQTVHVFAELVVFLDEDAPAAAARRARLDERAGSEYRSDALIFTGTAAQLADLLQGWHQAGISGFRLRPAAIPRDLTAITRGLVPELQRRGAFRRAYEPATLRARLGLPRPVNRYGLQVSSAANEEHQ